MNILLAIGGVLSSIQLVRCRTEPIRGYVLSQEGYSTAALASQELSPAQVSWGRGNEQRRRERGEQISTKLKIFTTEGGEYY